MIESFDSQLKQQKTEQYAGQLQPAWRDKSESNQLFAKPGSTASLDNLNTASLYHSENSIHSASDIGAQPTSDGRVRQTDHKVKAGETVEGMARDKLGPNASAEDVQRYADYVARINNIVDENGKNERPKPGTSLKLPARSADNSLSYTNPENRNETWKLNADDTSCHHMPLDKHGSYFEEHQGPNARDNYDQTYNHKADSTIVRRDADNGDVVKTAFHGTDITTAPQATKIIHENGDWEEKCGTDSQVSSAKYIKSENKRVDNFKDGSVVTTFINGDKEENEINHTETIQKDGAETCKTTKTPDGSYSIERTDEKGNVTSKNDRKYLNNGGYNETGAYTKDGKPIRTTNNSTQRQAPRKDQNTLKEWMETQSQRLLKMAR